MYGWFGWVIFRSSRDCVRICFGWVVVGRLFVRRKLGIYLFLLRRLPFICVCDIIGLYRSDMKISGKFGIIRIDIFILAYALLPISIVDRIETYC